MLSPLVTVIIPNYNHAKYLDERLQSVLNQTYSNFEVIVLDDMSSDNSLDIINKYVSHPKMSQIVKNNFNSGSPFKQWNKGFRLAKGELIWIAESDDSCDLTMLQKLVDAYMHYDNIVLAFCRTMLMNEDGICLRVFQKYFNQTFFEGNAFIKQKLIWGNCVVNASSAIFRKDIALQISDEYTHYRGVGDWLFWAELSEQGNVTIVDEPLNHYRYYETNTTSKNRKEGNEIKEAKKIIDYFVSKGHVGYIDKIRIHKKYIWHIKYEGHYNKIVQKQLLKTWNNNLLISFLAFLSNLSKLPAIRELRNL